MNSGSDSVVGASSPAGLDLDGQAIFRAAKRVESWVEEHDYQAYEPFDGLSSPLRKFTFRRELLERFLQQAVRQCPLNIRPLVGVKPLPSTKGRGYMAAGYLRMYSLTGDPVYRDKAIGQLEWLMEHKSPKFSEYSWANHFDYTSRGGHYGKDESIIVWTSLIGQAFLDGFELLGDRRYLDVADSACRWITALPREDTATGICFSYHNLFQSSIHNSNMLGAALLARTWRHAGRTEYLGLASAAMEYSCTRQLPTGAWWYGEDPKYHWIDNFHTGYNLDSLRCYIESTGNERFRGVLHRGFNYYTATFFEDTGRPRYYHNRTQPVDIQCASQAIETLAKFSADNGCALPVALRAAAWTIENMQDPAGYFYYRRYPLIVARIPMLHWGQATMYHALSVLLTARAAKHQHPARVNFRMTFRSTARGVVDGKEVLTTGRFLKTIRLRSESHVPVDDPASLIREVKRSTLRADILTFVQSLDEQDPKYAYHCEREELAVLPITTYEDWFTKRLYNKPRNMVRKAMKSGVEIRLEEFSDRLLCGIKSIYDDAPLRQGKRNYHYHKDLDTIREEHSRFLDRSQFIAAYHADEMIGFAKLTFSQGSAIFMNFLSKVSHREKAVNNAIVAKAVEISANRGARWLVYGAWGTEATRGLNDFKTANGFRCVEVVRYYVPLTPLGRLALRAGVHRGLLRHMPEWFIHAAAKVRRSWNELRVRIGQGARGAS